ncbi:MAG: 4-hydroxy-tetrahydrodipicolinate reductase [Flavobacteriales bacterium]|nr:4-hydroxy-tetrahydrodipicolinate reductase [Flavobacteriales bacterium]
MKLALYGYGKMGKAIEAVAIGRGHTVPLKVGTANAGSSPVGTDIAIEFSRPDQVLGNIRLCLEAGVPIVVGTTGWNDHLAEVRAMVQANQGALLWASNFSIGVNLFFRLNKQLTLLMDPQPGYQVRIDEVHHVHKLDAPSGTAITLARDIDLKSQRYSGWQLVSDGHPRSDRPGPVPITSERTGEVPGKHSISWTSAEDRITITHDAFGRQGFAHGAVVAAEWLLGKRGIFTMDDVLDPSH